jgi:hypothetical protein
MKKLSAFAAIISIAVFFIYSCQKDKPDSTSSSGNSNTLRTTVTGIVLDESNAPLNGVTVTAYGQTTTTNQYGTFVLKNLNANKDRCVLQFTKAGFFKRSHGLIASANTVNYVRIVLLSNTPTQSFSASVGGTVTLPDGSCAGFQPNSIVTSNGSAYTGTVNLIVKHLSPDDANFGFTIPGGDLLGKDAGNKDVALYTYGMLGVELTGSSGEALHLAPGTPATLTMAIAASQLSSAPASIPLWYFDETTSLWKEEGAANKVGNNYVGTVAHFSWWNCDVGANSPFVKGRIVDCNGNPLSNIIVTANNFLNTITDQNGVYSSRVPEGYPFTIQVLTLYNPIFTQNSAVINVPALMNNTTYVVPDLSVYCPSTIKGTLENCNGEKVEGLVQWYLNNYNGAYYVNGNFTIAAPPNSNVHFTATDGNFSYEKDITTLGLDSVLNLNAIKLCDTTDFSFLPDNCLYIYNSTCQNDTLILLDSNTYGVHGSVYYNHTGIAYNFLTGGSLSININGSSLGSYDWFHDQYTSIQGHNMYNMGNINCSHNVPGIITLIEVGPVNGRIKGTFIGKLWFDHYSGLDCWIYVKGKFDVPRTQ